MNDVTGNANYGALAGAITSGASLDAGTVRQFVADTIGRIDNLGAATESFSGTFGAIKLACSNAFQFIKYDIFMNFVQQIGLWFDSFSMPEEFQEAWRGFMDFISLVWSFVTGISELIIFYLWSSLSCILFILWLVQKTKDPAKEIQGPNTYGWQKRGKLWLLYTKFLVQILTTLYLPTMNSCFKVMFCDPTLMAFYEMYCYEGKHIGHLAFALFVFFFIGLFLPYVIWRVIRTYQPVPQGYDSEGNKIDVKRNRKEYIQQYHDLVQHDECPYAFLYSGYEYGWSAYKVITLVMKMLLVIPCIPFIHQEIASVSFSLGIITIYCLCSTIMRPFLMDSDDWLDICARLTSFITLVMQLLVATKILQGEFAGLILMLFHIVNIVVMVVLILSSFDFVRYFFRNLVNNLKLTDDMEYNINKCRKQMIWQRFWRSILASEEVTMPAYDRLMELDDIVRRVGKRAYRSGLVPPNREIAQMRRMARELEGVDVYYKGEVTDPTYWGKMYIKPYPFVCVVVYDVSEKSVEIHDHNIQEFIRQNLMDEEVVNGRKIRRALRCLDGEMVHYECEVDILPIGGASCSIVPQKCKCTNGYLTVQTKSNDMFCHGFSVEINFADGEYTDSLGKVHCNQHCTLTGKDLGIGTTFSSTPEVLKLLNDRMNMFLIETKWDELHERMKFFRDDLEEIRDKSERELSYAFWLLIYNNHFVPREQLVAFLQKFETNESLKNIVERRKTDFDSLYARLRYFDAHPAISYWYSFWDDVYTNNKGLGKIKRNRELFDLTSRFAIAYHPISVSKLRENLQILGLSGKCCCNLFKEKVLQKLEDKLDEYGMEKVNFSKVHYVTPATEDSITDPRCKTTFILPTNATYIASAFMLAWNGKE